MRRMTSKRYPIIFGALLLLFTVLVTGLTALFTDHVTYKMNITIASFDQDGYSLSATHPDGPFIAGETFDIKLSESNTKDTSIDTVIHMTAKWSSPDPNSNGVNSAILTLDGTPISYTDNNDGSISFQLPVHTLAGGAKDQSRTLSFQVPESLKATGELTFIFDKVDLQQSGGGFTAAYNPENLDFTVKVGWDFGETRGNKTIMGYLVSSGIQYTIELDHLAGDGTMHNWTSSDTPPHHSYNTRIIGITFDEGITSIGDHAFEGFNRLTTLSLPSNLKTIGTSAFEDATGLTALTVPASVTKIEERAFYQNTSLTNITFQHTAGANLSLPNAGKNTGAFYVYPYLETTITGANTDAQAYNWMKDLRSPPTLAPAYTWYNSDQLETYEVTKIKFVTNYTVTGSETDVWNAAEDLDGDGVNDDDIICYLNGTELTIYGNTAPKIYANEYSNMAFSRFGAVTSIDNIEMLDTCKTVNMYAMFSDNYNLTDLEVGHFDLSNVTDISNMFYLCYELPEVDVADWDTSEVEFMAAVFTDCHALTDLSGVRNWDTQKVTTTHRMFLGVNNVQSLDLSSKHITLPSGEEYDSWDTGNVTNMAYMFGSSDSRAHIMESLNVSTFDMRNVTNMQAMFERCHALKSLNVSPSQITLNNDTFHTWDVGNVRKMVGTFRNCSSLKTLDLSYWDTTSVGIGSSSSIVESFAEMFKGCTALESLNVSRTNVSDINSRNYTSWNTSNAWHMSSMFEDCSSLKSLNLKNWNNASATEMNGMFSGCSSMASIDLTNFTTPKVRYMRTMFYKCSSLESVDISSFDTSNVSAIYNMFSYCSSLEKLDLSNFDTSSISRSNLSTERFAQYCTSLTEIVLGPNFMQSVNVPSAGSSSGLFYVGSPYSSSELLGTKVTGANSTMLNYNWSSDFRGYNVSVIATVGGSLTVSPTAAINGKTITLNPTPSSGYEYQGATVSYSMNGVSKTVTLDQDTKTFVMPAADDKTDAADVTVKPKWKLVAFPMLAERDTWQYTNPDTYETSIDYSLLQTINIVDSYEPAGTETSWDASAYETVNGVDYMGKVTAYLSSDKKTLTLAGNGAGCIYANPDSSWALSSEANWGIEALTRINGAEKLDTSLVTDASSMFSMNRNLEYVNVSNWDTSNIEFTNYSGYYGMFMSCASLKNLDVSKWDTGNMIEMRRMFSGCTSLNTIDVSKWDTSSCETTADMFAETPISTIAVDNWNTSNLYHSYGMFEGCKNLTEINLSNWDVSNLEMTSEMFADSGLEAIDLSSWDESVVSRTYSMFEGCTNLTDVNIVGWNLSNLETDTNDSYRSSAGMFNGCTSLEELTIPASLTTFGARFAYGCTKLTTITFQHDSSASVNFPTAGSSYGAFYIPSYLKTTINTGNQQIKSYGWGPDNRMEKIKHAVYSADDNSLIFYNNYLPEVGSTYHGKTVTAVYTGFEDEHYGFSKLPPWSDHISEVKTVSFHDEIAPIDTGLWFYNATSLTSFNTTNFNTSNVTEMNNMFHNCSSLQSLDLSALDTSKVEDMSFMFQHCDSLTNLKLGANFDTYNVWNMSYMFAWCESLSSVDISMFNTENATNMYGMFQKCTGMTSLNVSSFNTVNTENMGAMFAYCSSLTSLNLKNFDTSNVDNMGSMFLACSSLTSLDLSNFNTAAVLHMDSMFRDSEKLETLNLSSFDTSSVVWMSSMFSACKNLKVLDLSSFDTSSTENMIDMFNMMHVLEEVHLGAKFSFTGDGTTYITLPDPSAHKDNDDGKWYNSKGVGFVPADVPSNVADIYYAYPPANSTSILSLDLDTDPSTETSSITGWNIK